MPRLREVLADAGFDDVATLLQSGNVVVSAPDPAAQVARRIATAIAEEWSFDVPVVMRTRAEVARVLAADPLGDVVDDPKRYQVTFLDRTPPAGAFDDVDPEEFAPERFVLLGRELYTWTPEATGGIHGSKLLKRLARGPEDVVGTARNWSTVRRLLELADG